MLGNEGGGRWGGGGLHHHRRLTPACYENRQTRDEPITIICNSGRHVYPTSHVCVCMMRVSVTAAISLVLHVVI